MLNRPTSTPRFSYGDYCRWESDERWELIDGEAFDMSPAPSRRHQQVLFRLAADLRPPGMSFANHPGATILG